MGETTGISWCDHTFNPWIGCTRVSPACDGCYAAALMGHEGRHKRVVWGEPGEGAGTRSRTAPSTWNEPRKWDRKAKAEGVRRFVFCASLADVFDNEVPAEWRRDLFDLIRATPNLIWLLLTKRPQMIVKLFTAAHWPDHVDPSAAELRADWPSNAFAGTTVEDLARMPNVYRLLDAKDRLGIPLAFLSCEPLLEDIGHAPALQAMLGGRGIGWVIIGGETDQGKHKARPTHPRWERNIQQACAIAGVPFHKKQTGEWIHRSQFTTSMPTLGEKVPDRTEFYLWPDGTRSEKLGKKHTGRLLDGMLHDAMPRLP